MMKAIYYREHYYKLPDGVGFDAFKAGLPTEIELEELCENYGLTGVRDIGMSLAPYFISGYSKSPEKVQIDAPGDMRILPWVQGLQAAFKQRAKPKRTF